ncbi:MAG: hypothetical protein AAFX06_18635 [Planctomycetota bacterium]
MRFALLLFAFVGFVADEKPNVYGQESVIARNRPAAIGALDEPSGEMLRACFPSTTIRVVLLTDGGVWSRINPQDLSLTQVRCAFYQSDYSTLSSQLMRERLLNQGVRVVDLSSIRQHLGNRRASKSARTRGVNGFVSPMPQRLLSELLTAHVAELKTFKE